MAWRRGWPAAMLSAAFMVMSGCGDGADGHYVKNAGAGFFLEVPKDWSTFEIQRGKPFNSGLFATQSAWQVGIDASANPSRRHAEEMATAADPVGIVAVYPLDEDAEIEHTQRWLRALVLDGSDPLLEDEDDDSFEVLDYQELEFDSGHWGVRLKVRVEPSDGDAVIIDHTSLFDGSGTRLFWLRMGCTAECYDSHQQNIEAIVDSLTLERR